MTTNNRTPMPPIDALTGAYTEQMCCLKLNHLKLGLKCDIRFSLFLLIALLFFNIPLYSVTPLDVPQRTESQVIKLLFDYLKFNDLKKENTAVIIYKGHPPIIAPVYRQSDIIAWFDYKHDDKNIIINYFSFPRQNKVNDPLDYYGTKFEALLKDIAENNKFPDRQSAKQLRMPIPSGLQNKTLLNMIYSNKRLNLTRDGWTQVIVKECPPFYWDFKTNDSELSKYDSDYVINPLGQIIHEILNPIVNNILKRETPAQWKKEYEEHEKKLAFQRYL